MGSPFTLGFKLSPTDFLPQPDLGWGTLPKAWFLGRSPPLGCPITGPWGDGEAPQMVPGGPVGGGQAGQPGAPGLSCSPYSRQGLSAGLRAPTPRLSRFLPREARRPAIKKQPLCWGVQMESPSL